ncbi:MAG: winged helix-turn-helix domain-containing protein [Actinomycetota bacterium]|nr:winged helix-turn-helix domain-containing protein [Actinomycetota bacterium]
MSATVGQLLEERAGRGLVGRQSELAALLSVLDAGGPLVVFVHGLGGIGKSSLVRAFCREARQRGATAVLLDCRLVEPTERGLIGALAAATGASHASTDSVSARLAALLGRVVLTLDTYEVFQRLMDTWLRQQLIPALPANARIVISGREPPVPAWEPSGSPSAPVRSLALEPLDPAAATELLVRAGVRRQDAPRINRLGRGHPLALRVAAAAVTERPHRELEDAALPRVIQTLARLYLDDLEATTRRVVDAASVVRRATLSLLGTMLPDIAPQDAFDRLRGLPFVEVAHDGLLVHETLQEAVAGALHAVDPVAYRRYRRAAWCQLRRELRAAGTPEVWRYTADMLFLIENPVVREAFFPSRRPTHAIEPAGPDDAPAIARIVQTHEPSSAGANLLAWWERLRGSFRVARDGAGAVAGFYCMFDQREAGRAWIEADPVAAAWAAHLRANRLPPGQDVLFLPRWLSDDAGELPSEAQAAMWLDIKGAYMARRPRLRRLYTVVRDLATWAPAVSPLGFVPLAGGPVDLDGVAYHPVVLDFGPGSVDGWLAGLVAGELGVEEDELLDGAQRQVVIDGERIPLTRLEFGVLSLLVAHEGRVVHRRELLERVWGTDYEGGSNVVAAVVRTLRRKLGAHASMVATVRGLGYRFERP